MSNRELVIEYIKKNINMIRLFNEDIKMEVINIFPNINEFDELDKKDNAIAFTLIKERPYLYPFLNDNLKKELNKKKDFALIIKGIEMIRNKPSLITSVRKEIREIALKDPEIFSKIKIYMEMDDNFLFNDGNIRLILKIIETDREETQFLGDVTTVNCPKCDNNRATFKRISMWADEPDFIIYKCIKCGHSWRIGGVSGV